MRMYSVENDENTVRDDLNLLGGITKPRDPRYESRLHLERFAYSRAS